MKDMIDEATDDATDAHFGLKLIDRDGGDQSLLSQLTRCKPGPRNADEPRLCGPSLLTGPQQPQPSTTAENSFLTLMGFEPTTFRPAFRSASRYATGIECIIFLL